MKELSSQAQEFAPSAAIRELSARVTPPGIEECWLDLDGGRIRYLRSGSGPPLILLHGLLGYSFSWRYTMPALVPYATVYAPDMLGAGFSERPATLDHSLRANAGRLLQFVERLGISSFDLLGTSHGGAVAMMAAAQLLANPQHAQIRKLILVAPVNPFSAHGRRLAPFFGSSIGATLFRFGADHMPFLFPWGHARMYGSRDRIPPGTLEGYMAPLEVPGFFEHGLSIVRTWTTDLRELHAILPALSGLPTLFMWGSKDGAVYVSSAKPLAQYFPDSRLVVFPGVGHLPYEECADDFNHALIEFLTKTEFLTNGAPR